jgi:hypothetical protein
LIKTTSQASPNTPTPEISIRKSQVTISDSISFNPARGIQAYFISPRSLIVRVKSSHISLVWDCPEFFGVRRTDLEKLHDKYSEKYGIEGIARKIVLSALLEKGWVRIRLNKGVWTVECYRVNKQIAKRINSWVAQMITKKLINDSSEILVKTLDGKSQFQIEIQSVA